MSSYFGGRLKVPGAEFPFQGHPQSASAMEPLATFQHVVRDTSCSSTPQLSQEAAPSRPTSHSAGTSPHWGEVNDWELL